METVSRVIMSKTREITKILFNDCELMIIVSKLKHNFLLIEFKEYNCIKDQGYDDIFFVDDSPLNIEAVKDRLLKYPNVKKKIQ